MMLSHRAPETFDSERFTEQSDVWSYGVCLYELFSLGKKPYEGVNDILKFVKDGGRLAKPHCCHPEIYEIMRECWNAEIFSRPTFSAIVTKLEEHFDRYDIPIPAEVKNKLQEASDHQATLRDWI